MDTALENAGRTIWQKKEDCCGCSACFAVCPRQAVRMVPDGEGFLYAVIDEERCVHCDLCVRVCPIIQQDRADRQREESGKKRDRGEEGSGTHEK